MHTKKIRILSTALIIFISLLILNTDTAFSAKNDADTDIAVKDYTWLSSGSGRAAILKDITLINKSSKDYKNIEVKIDLYSRSGVPLGTLRATINKILPSNSEQTYKNIKMGIMSTSLEDSTAKIVRAELSGRAKFEDPRNLIVIKDWKFKGGNYSTEGFIF